MSLDITIVSPERDPQQCSHCPFDMSILVKPFKKLDGWLYWHGMNCEECRHSGKCGPQDILEKTMTQKSKTITLETAKQIGCFYDPLYQTVKMWPRCRNFDSAKKPF